jgi:hypothetical protein
MLVGLTDTVDERARARAKASGLYRVLERLAESELAARGAARVLRHLALAGGRQ